MPPVRDPSMDADDSSGTPVPLSFLRNEGPPLVPEESMKGEDNT